MLSSQVPLPPACLCSGNHRTCAVSSGPTVPCLPLDRDPQKLCCWLWTHCPQQAAQGLAGPLVLSRDILPSHWHNSGTRSTCLMSLAPCCQLRDLQTRGVISVRSAWLISGTRRTCSVVSGPTAPCLLLLKHLQDIWCHLATHDFLPADAEEPVQPVVLSQDSLPTVCC